MTIVASSKRCRRPVSDVGHECSRSGESYERGFRDFEISINFTVRRRLSSSA